METTYTKTEIIEAMQDVVRPLVGQMDKMVGRMDKMDDRMDRLETELAKKPDREEVRLMLKTEVPPMIKAEIAPLKHELAEKPNRDEVRRIVREEITSNPAVYIVDKDYVKLLNRDNLIALVREVVREVLLDNK